MFETNNSTIFEHIQREMDRQIDLRESGKFEETAEDMCKRGDLDAMYRVLGEEVGEVARALNEGAPLVHVIEELIQVCAVSCAAIRGIDYAMVAAASAI